ncbi:plasmid mobilization relaxosome protein MobC [Actinomadura litoris]|uniref:plasmid mobilization relaxosome protein MobC n=1 Tax=Actinomadura litoris TaxID=2678616 RepID=UPI001FA6EF24|nr:plasmid mobilization relaxosome protein MobC [Actinomadura litoris]
MRISRRVLSREVLATVMHAAGQVRRIGVNLNQVAAALNSGEVSPQLRWYVEAAARSVRNLDGLADELRRRLP